MKLNLNQFEDWDDYDLDADENEIIVKRFPRENKTIKNYKKSAIRKKRQEKMNEREQEGYRSYEK